MKGEAEGGAEMSGSPPPGWVQHQGRLLRRCSGNTATDQVPLRKYRASIFFILFFCFCFRLRFEHYYLTE